MAPAMMPAPGAGCDVARVMICDDSAVIRAAIARILDSDPAINVVARVGNGQAALDALKLHSVDVVVLDIEMPVMDGMTALPALLRADPGVKVIMASTLTTRGADIAMRALRLGAADYVPKPSSAGIGNGVGVDRNFGADLIEKVKGLARLRRRTAPVGGLTGREPGTRMAARAAWTLAAAPRKPANLLAIGSSTGGPNALFTLIPALGDKLRVPIVLTQHMPATFTAILAEHITKLGGMPCREARHGEVLRAGEIVLAPGDRHLLVHRRGASLICEVSDTPQENFCRPAVDPMLRSACAATDGAMLVVMLTGMGQDGLIGTRMVVQAGGAAIAQDEASSVVWGMPGAIARESLAHLVLPLAQIGGRTRAMLGGVA